MHVCIRAYGLFVSFVHVTLGRYHEGVTGDKYNCYHDAVRVRREIELEHHIACWLSLHRLLIGYSLPTSHCSGVTVALDDDDEWICRARHK